MGATGTGSTDLDASSDPLDLAAYLRHIGCEQARAADRPTLAAIVAAHSRRIAFENLDPFLGRPVALDPASLQSKLVEGGRGGYCFEQNLLLAHALRALGYQTTGLAARVLWRRPPGAPLPARGHMLVRVDLPEGPHLVDVGFGGLTLTGVLRLEVGSEQVTLHEPFRLVAAGDDLVMEAEVGGAWHSLYQFGLAEALQSDYEVASWYLSNHPESHFVTGLMAARAPEGRRYALSGRQLTVHHLDGASERRLAESPTELMAALEEDFLLDLTRLAGLEAALTRLW